VEKAECDMNTVDFIPRLHLSLPKVRKWIEKTLAGNQEHAVPVINFKFSRLKKLFSGELLNSTKAVVLSEKLPFPPLDRMGLPEFIQMEKMAIAGITYKDTFFVSHLQQNESLYFHELVHVVQWERLGVDNFLLAYGAGLMQFGYANSPLEKMAYSLQADFDRGEVQSNFIEEIQQNADATLNDIRLS